MKDKILLLFKRFLFFRNQLECFRFVFPYHTLWDAFMDASLHCWKTKKIATLILRWTSLWHVMEDKRARHYLFVLLNKGIIIIIYMTKASMSLSTSAVAWKANFRKNAVCVEMGVPCQQIHSFHKAVKDSCSSSLKLHQILIIDTGETYSTFIWSVNFTTWKSFQNQYVSRVSRRLTRKSCCYQPHNHTLIPVSLSKLLWRHVR